MAFAKTSIYRRYPFKKNDLQIGFGHEDWHWNSVTLAAGHAHKPVPETVHFKRRRQGSQSAKVSERKEPCGPFEAQRCRGLIFFRLMLQPMATVISVESTAG